MKNTKKCPKCGRTKGEHLFNEKHTWCKKCMKKYNKKRYEEKKEYFTQYYSSIHGIVSRLNAQIKSFYGIEDKVTEEEIKELLEYFDYKCAYTGVDLRENGVTMSFDHVKCLSDGGEHRIWNIVPCLRNVNSSKNNRDLNEWYKEQSYFDEERLNKISGWQEYSFFMFNKNEQTISI